MRALVENVAEGIFRTSLDGRILTFNPAAERLTGAPRASLADRRDLALVILTRVLFLYFVQGRGWLAGRSDYLPSLLDTALGRGHPFHRSVFEPLCYGALNAPPGRRTRAALALGDLPFLNGGLFVDEYGAEQRGEAARRRRQRLL
jgi:hypothetical protein